MWEANDHNSHVSHYILHIYPPPAALPCCGCLCPSIIWRGSGGGNPDRFVFELPVPAQTEALGDRRSGIVLTCTAENSEQRLAMWHAERGMTWQLPPQAIDFSSFSPSGFLRYNGEGKSIQSWLFRLCVSALGQTNPHFCALRSSFAKHYDLGQVRQSVLSFYHPGKFWT